MCMPQESTGALLERVLDARIRRRVECYFGEEQQGFVKGRGTSDGMYVLRQMVEKRLEVQGSMALGFVVLEKAFDTVPREMVMATLRWMGIPEAEVRMVEGTYEKTTARVVVGEGSSDEFEVKIGLRQGSVLSPLLFIAVLDLISMKTVVKDAMKIVRMRRRRPLSEFAPVNIHSKLHFRLNIITFSRNSNLYSSSGGKKPFRFKFACKISQIFEIMYSLCSAGAGNPGNHAHD